ncbi:putative leader peptide [Acidothermus cellulolyticus]
MSRSDPPTVLLVARLHVDLLRVSSAVCMPAC